MNFNEALKTIDLIIKSQSVPLLVGESGIGKTALTKELCRKNFYHLVNIDANLLKEGEIGGLPTVEEYNFYDKGRSIKGRKTVYAMHTKLLEVEEYLRENPEKEVMLFIDEINRCDHNVQQELMNLILNREINGYYLKEAVHVMAAMNPSNKYDAFEDTEYEVVDMDEAQENRFVWVYMESNFKDWISWGAERGDIHPHILEFISVFPQYLHRPKAKDTVKATPRSWERVSKAYSVYLKNKESYSKNIFYNVVKGNVGGEIAQDFISYISDYKPMPIRAEELFSNQVMPSNVKDIILKEGHARLYIMAKNLLMYLDKEKHEEKDINIFSNVLKCYPVDLRISIMKDIRADYKDGIYKELLEDDDFINAFFECY